MTFEVAYKALNTNQRKAVDLIDGPVLVVAGPGTGKTQLLSLRAANIVRLTDTLPSNILCLTFTDSAAAEMRARLLKIMGAEGNKIAVHTFHSFGSDIINRNPEYFYNGGRFKPTDDLTTYEILEEIFESLSYSSPLAKTMNGKFTALPDSQTAISHLKKAGLTPDELLAVLKDNEEFYDQVEPGLTKLFDLPRLSKKDLPQIRAAHAALPPYERATLAEVFNGSLARALDEAEAQNSTTPVTAWRNQWLEKNTQNQFVFKDRRQSKKLRALAHVYQKYREILQKRELFDYDDMVSLVAHTLEANPDLCLNLQEQYLYIMVDEFQDTNGAQQRLLSALADNPVNEGRPNILAVGDDDQAIYAFQGAELSNIMQFKDRYHDTALVTLTDNYRSSAKIIAQARQVITNGEERLENLIDEINKTLTPHNPKAGKFSTHQFTTMETEYNWVSAQIKKQIAAGTPAGDIAVIARRHNQLTDLIPYLHTAGLTINYERRNNVLESPHIDQLLVLAEVVEYLAEQRFDAAEAYLPELLSYEFWDLNTQELWQLSLRAYKENRLWLELMLQAEGKLRQIGEFLVVTSHEALHQPLEIMLDILIGGPNAERPGNSDYCSPYYAHYFSLDRLSRNPALYMKLLSNLRALRKSLANYRPDAILSLRSLVDFVDTLRGSDTAIVDKSDEIESQDSVNLLTAHKAKGREFDTVYVLNCQDQIWGRKARHHNSSIIFPPNLAVTPAGELYDDKLRLFFVAMTRAKNNLFLTSASEDNSGKPAFWAEFLQPITADQPAEKMPNTTPAADQLEPGWQIRHFTLPVNDQKIILAPVLGSYQLSPTHLNSFLDVTRGGPQAFLLQNLLRFPQAQTPSQIFGKLIHATLQRAHTHLRATGEKRPLEDILYDYEQQLRQTRLSEEDFNYLLEKGSEVLQAYLRAKYDSFTPTQKTERSFASQHITVDGARITGVVDLLEVDETNKTVVVTDYKTGKGHSSWRGGHDYDRIKLHKYRQQLMFYKLLIENSAEYSGYTVTKGVLEFVEPDTEGELYSLELAFDAQELADFRKLITTVWQHIQDLNLPDTSQYSPDYKGILDFESSLV